jgi:methylated-DNA-[protein]-cysteine S-methyltransferase
VELVAKAKPNILRRIINMSLFYYKTDIGKIAIEDKNGKIAAIYFQGEELPLEIDIFESPILKEAADQIKRYFEGGLKHFSLPLDPAGTPFMKEVWGCLCEIPYGRTLTYKQVAEEIGRPKSARAVGAACSKNPIPIIIPCHRVIGKSGNLTGYAGGLDIKEKLLRLEGNIYGII